MSLDNRFSRLALAALVLVGAVRLEASKGAGAFTPFLPEPLPQRALGDFDGDGRPDLALIQVSADGPHVSLRLSGSPDAVYLEAAVAGLIKVDIDHDGDLDLAAVTPTGDVMIWLNDGQGRFTQQEASHSPGLSRQAFKADTLQDGALALGGMTAPLVAPRTPIGAAYAVSRIRQPTVPLAFTLDFLLHPSLRAPPLLSLSLP